MAGRWTAMFCLSVLSLTSVFTKAKAAQPEKTKTESELHIGISEAAFNLIAKHLDLAHAPIQRTDVYFDFHEGQKFHLRRNISQAKLRIQMRENELVLQKSWVKEQREFSANSYIWLATTRTSSNLKQSYSSEAGDRVKFSIPFLLNISKQNSMTPEQRRLLEETWSGIAWPKLTEFDTAASTRGKSLIPAAVVRKERWIIEIPYQHDKRVTLQLGRDSDALGQGKPVSFEIESELKNATESEMSDVANTAALWLESLGIGPEETTARSSHDFFKRLENIYP